MFNFGRIGDHIIQASYSYILHNRMLLLVALFRDILCPALIDDSYASVRSFLGINELSFLIS